MVILMKITQIKIICVVMATLLIACSDPEAASEAHVVERAQFIRATDTRIREVIGIGIYDIGLLAQADRDNYLLEDALTPLQQNALQSLSKQGYIELSRVNAEDGVYVNYSPTVKGKELMDALR